MNRIALLTLAVAAATASTAAFAQSTAAQSTSAPSAAARPSAQDAGPSRARAHAFQRDQAGRGDFRRGASGMHGMHGEMRGGMMRGGMEGLARLDVDHDGRISRAEAAGQGRMSGRLAGNFDAIDANRDGYIVRTELRSWGERMRAQRMATMRKKFEERFAKADANHDGKLSKAEVVDGMPRLAVRFAWMDDNRDGFLSRGELEPKRMERR